MLQALLQELRQLDTSRRSLRSFGLLVGGIVVLIAVWLIWRSGSFGLLQAGRFRPAVGLAVIGVALLALGLVRPNALRPLYFAWMTLAVAIGAVMTRIVLSIVFVILIIPVGLAMRLLGRDPLQRQRSPGQKTYWISREDMDRSVERLEKYY